jgi:HAD superfamily hydrolase (TIGR01509 family)
VTDAVVFDLDGVLVDSEQTWADAKRDLVERTGGTWKDEATLKMLGMSSPEWSAYLHDDLGVPRPPEEISRQVAERMVELYREDLPLLPGAVEAVRRMQKRWPLGLATSSNREVIDTFLELTGLTDAFATTISTEEVAAGKPSPDVYLEAAKRLGVEPQNSVAIEDSTNGMRAGLAAGMRVIAIPNPHFPPDPDVLAQAPVVLGSLGELTEDLLRGLTP